MRRYQEIIVKTQGDIKVSFAEEDGKLVVMATQEKIEEENSGIQEEVEIEKNPEGIFDYNNPYIPNGYEYVFGHWNDGFVIERITDGSQFVWVPVNSLDRDGVLEGIGQLQCFGRRNFRKDSFMYNAYNEDFDLELRSQFESVQKYGGFYISRFNIVKDDDEGFKSIPGHMAYVSKNYNEIKRISDKFETSDCVKSHLVYGSEYDCVLSWFIKSGSRMKKDIVKDSTECGNYWNNSMNLRQKSVTGMLHEWSTNEIYDFFGNCEEWTQELYGRKYKNSQHVIRGGNYNMSGFMCPVSYRNKEDSYSCKKAAFRVALWIK